MRILEGYYYVETRMTKPQSKSSAKISAQPPEWLEPLLEKLNEELRASGLTVTKGIPRYGTLDRDLRPGKAQDGSGRVANRCDV